MSFVALLRLMRPHQWLKNVLVFLPLLSAHEVLNHLHFQHALGIFVLFSGTASVGYIVNDWCDRHTDRQHPTKKNRPLASGAVSPTQALLLALALLMAVFWGALPLGMALLLVLGAYLSTSLMYTILLKRYAILDVLVLAMLYTSRMWAGAVGTGLQMTFWMAIFSLFLFTSLSLIKRYTECHVRGHNNPQRGYNAQDATLMATMGINTAGVAVLVLALYLKEMAQLGFYAHSGFLFFSVPVVLFWIMRLWRLTLLGRMNDDPVIFTLRDPLSFVLGLTFLGCLVVAR